MNAGFFAKGNAGNFIVDDVNPVMAQIERGEIVVTAAVNGGFLARAYGQCTVTYAKVITTDNPPWVFGVPSTAGSAGGGIGFFEHLGGPRAWTGFRVAFTPRLQFDSARQVSVGMHTGWEYRVCDFYLPPSNERYGLRVWDDQQPQRLVFDSGWPIVPLRSLLRNWQLVGAYKTGIYNYLNYWGNIRYDPNKQVDGTYQWYTHAWGAADGDLGILISQLRVMSFYGDNGVSGYAEMPTPPMIGFRSGDRSQLTCALHLGILQHAGASVEPLNNFALLTADFSRV